MVRFYRPKEIRGIRNLVLGVTEDKKSLSGLTARIPGIQRAIKLGDVTGKLGEINVFYPPSGPIERVILCGLGKGAELEAEEVRKAVGLAVQRAVRLKVREAVFEVGSFCHERLEPVETSRLIVLAGQLASYRYLELKKEQDEDLRRQRFTVSLCIEKKPSILQAVKMAEDTADSVNYARTLANRPGNVLYPEVLAKEAVALAKKDKRIKVKILRHQELRRQGFGALMAVGIGSVRPPVLIDIRYQGASSKQAPVALVGKGITFDSGGISIKPSAKMEEMRFDMSGAAAVLGIIKAAAAMRLPVNLLGVVPAAENMPSGTATRPGDVVTSLSGKSIEIINTDAEGRLILADALTYSLRHKPACILDFATLTGAVIVALGTYATGLLTNCDQMGLDIAEAGNESGEKTWQLPIWDEYRQLMKSEVADIANISSKSGAGTIQGAVFLERFIGDTPWVHLDIAGTAYGDKTPLSPKGATGVGIRLTLAWLLAQKNKHFKYKSNA
ncbi:MAG: leucyl aminopeptidase [candidate division FCPU426 bacterium]